MAVSPEVDQSIGSVRLLWDTHVRAVKIKSGHDDGSTSVWVEIGEGIVIHTEWHCPETRDKTYRIRIFASAEQATIWANGLKGS